MNPSPRPAPPDPSSAAPAGLSTVRIVALADGIFAIVMTLLIFNLQAPPAQATSATSA